MHIITYRHEPHHVTLPVPPAKSYYPDPCPAPPSAAGVAAGAAPPTPGPAVAAPAAAAPAVDSPADVTPERCSAAASSVLLKRTLPRSTASSSVALRLAISRSAKRASRSASALSNVVVMGHSQDSHDSSVWGRCCSGSNHPLTASSICTTPPPPSGAPVRLLAAVVLPQDDVRQRLAGAGSQHLGMREGGVTRQSMKVCLRL